MNHQNIQEKLPAFHDLELPTEEHREITVHLALCKECREILKRLEQVSAVLSRAAIQEPSEKFVIQVMGRLAQLKKPAAQPEPAQFFPKWLFPAIGYGLALLLMFVAISYRAPIVNTETVLLAGTSQGTQWSFSKEVPDINKLFVTEEEI